MKYDKKNDRYISENDDLRIYPDGSNFRECGGLEIDLKDDYIIIPIDLISELIDGLSQARQRLIANGKSA